MTDRVFNVLFLCTGNSARSIIAEAVLNKDGQGRFRAFSGGSAPKGSVHPLTLEVLQSYGYPTEGLHSKSWTEFSRPDAPRMDFVFTVCDQAAGEVCPVWPGQPMTAHWGVDDPAAATGTLVERTAAFVATVRYTRSRLSVFMALPIGKLDEIALRPRLVEIGLMEGASTLKPRVA